MDLFQAIILGIVQGLTEFLPISSSAHLRVIPALFGWDDPGAAFTAVTQIGTIAAVILYFWKDLVRILNAWTQALYKPAWRSHPDAKLGWFVLLGTVPIGVLGLLFERQIDTVARDLRLIAGTLIVLGIVLLIADRNGSHQKTIGSLTLRDALIFGFAQALALIPGVSRSGATISAGLFLGYNRTDAARYSFLLSIPAIVASGFFKLADLNAGDGPNLSLTLVATVLAFISGYASIAWLLRYVGSKNYTPFVTYRLALGVLIIVLLFVGWLKPRDGSSTASPSLIPSIHLAKQARACLA